MAAEPSLSDLALWGQFVKAHANAIWARHQLFLKSKPCLPELLQQLQTNPASSTEAAVKSAIKEVGSLLAVAPPKEPERKPTPEDQQGWAQFVVAHSEAQAARRDLMKRCADRVAVVRKGLSATGEERTAALDLAADLNIEERKWLLGDLVALAGYAHGQTQHARALILTLPRDWLLHHLESAAEPLLKDGTEEEYRALFELYLAVDRLLAQKLAQRAASHHDPEVQECADDFVRELNPNPRR